MSASPYKRMANKFGAIKTNGYASKKEARRAAELKLLERAGEITNLHEQVKFGLLPKQTRSDGSMERKVEYIADFTYEDTVTGKCIVEDVKGMRLPEYIIKRKLMLYIHVITVLET